MKLESPLLVAVVLPPFDILFRLTVSDMFKLGGVLGLSKLVERFPLTIDGMINELYAAAIEVKALIWLTLTEFS